VLEASADRARAVVGRCLAYGDGITFWPLVEIIRQLGSGDARRRRSGSSSAMSTPA
jgi:hypothetical protein